MINGPSFITNNNSLFQKNPLTPESPALSCSGNNLNKSFANTINSSPNILLNPNIQCNLANLNNKITQELNNYNEDLGNISFSCWNNSIGSNNLDVNDLTG